MQWAEHGRVVTLASGQCECGLRPLARQPSCATRRDRLFARDVEQPGLYWRFHRLAVDAYCLQHESYIKSAKSFAAHLGGICIALEHGNDPGVHQSLVQWL